MDMEAREEEMSGDLFEQYELGEKLPQFETRVPDWLARISEYFTDASEIDEVIERSAKPTGNDNVKSGQAVEREDPLNQQEYVELIIRFRRNGSGPIADATEMPSEEE